MWKLTIEDDEGKRTPLPLARDEYTIGRGEENTVRLTERNISRRHAILRRTGSAWLVLDCASSNGSYVNGVRIGGEHLIAQGDLLQLGDYRLEFADEDASARTAGSNVTTLPGAGTAVKPDRLVVVIGPEPGAEFVVQQAQVTIGRAPELDVCLPHGSVSRVHAEIHALGNGRYEILDRGSANGVRVNGSLLKRGLLEAGDFIELGEVKLKFVGAGQLYRPGPEAMRLPTPGEVTESPTVRPPPTSNLVFGTTSSINDIDENAFRPHNGRLWMAGAGGAIAILAGLLLFGRGTRSPAPAASVLAASAAQTVASGSIDPSRQLLEEIKQLAAQGDLDAAHQRIMVDATSAPTISDAPEAREIESRWADSVLARASVERDIATRRSLLSMVAQATLVDAGRRRIAAEKLKETDYLATDVKELPKAKGSQASMANGSPDSPPKPRAVLAADPWSQPAAATRSSSLAAQDPQASKATDLALQGRDGEAKARAQLEPRVWSGRASPEEIRMLRAICKHMGDRACIDRATALLSSQK
jgi:pSer/pThr/pTyr-binding forkhead associated (FHA) protein